MEDNAIISILEELKTSSRSRIVNNLIKIRQQVIATDEGIHKLKKHGGLAILVPLLHKPNEKILDLVLSIIGNCCLHRECVHEVVKLNGVRPTLHLLKNIAKDSVLCRACRVIGNIAQFETSSEILHSYGAVETICSLLENSNSTPINTPTKQMAVRTLRLLWTTLKRQQEMLAKNAVQSVSKVLIQHTPNWISKQEDKELLMGILKCLVHFTSSPSHDCVVQIIADGAGFQSIVSLIPLSPYLAVKCITNLATVATTRSQMETASAVQILVSRLNVQINENTAATWPLDDLSALCLLCRHAATREELRLGNALPIFLSVIKNGTNKHQVGQVLHALLYFIYDEASLQILMSNGLVSILVNCFSKALEGMSCQHNTDSLSLKQKKKNILDLLSTKRLLKTKRQGTIESFESKHNSAKKAKIISSNDSEGCSTRSSRSDENDIFSLVDTRLSPQPSSCYSPSSTSPINFTEDDSDSDDSIRYSPVCSDSEESEKDANPVGWDATTITLDDDFIHYELVDIDLENAVEEELEPKTGENRLLGWLLVLLSRTVYMEEADPALANIDTLDVLVRYMSLSSEPISRAARILLRIVGRWDYLIPLLNNKFIIRLHQMVELEPHGKYCRQCQDIKRFVQILLNKLTCVAETGYGRGEIAFLLLRGEEAARINLVISTPYLIQSKVILRSFFATHKGLQILLDALSKGQMHDWKEAVNALGLLATKLKIKDPKLNEIVQTVHKVSCVKDEKIKTLREENIVEFQLDDGSVVQADKALLTEKSDFFKVLLTGMFKESEQEVVRLTNVTNNGFVYLLKLLDYYRVKKLNKSFPLCYQLSVALEVLVLTDRYLIENIMDFLSRAVLVHLMSSENVAEIYKWSVVSGTDFLRVESVAYGLVGHMEQTERAQIFEDIMKEEYKTYFINDLQTLLHRYLKIDA